MEADVAREMSRNVSPQYVRFQEFDGVRIARYVKRWAAEGGPAGAVESQPAAPRPRPSGSRAEAGASSKPQASVPATGNTPPSPESQEANDAGTLDIENYVWTGTQLKRRDELTPEERDWQTDS